MEATKNKGGRPRKYPGTEKRPTLQFRARGETYERLKRAAEASDRSISEEIEAIIMAHFAEDRLRAVIRDELARCGVVKVVDPD